MKRFHLHLGQQIQLRGTLYPFNVTLNIVGTIGGKAPPNFLLFRRDYLEEAAGRPGIVDNIWVKVDKPENVPQVIAAIDEGFANSSAETLSESEAAFIGSFLDQYRTFFRMAELLGFIVVLMIGLVAANTAAMSIRERRGEIAVMRSIGFPARTILSLLLAESILIGLVGGIIGCGSAYIVLKVFSVGGGGGPAQHDPHAADDPGRNPGRGRTNRTVQRNRAGQLGGAAQYRRCAKDGCLRWLFR